MTCLAVIPARWRSERFPGKALAMIAGEPMVVRVWRQVKLARSVDAIVVATDDERIRDVCVKYGIDCEMTAIDHASGTDRLAEVATRRDAAIFVNVQGDEPLIDPRSIDATVECLKKALPRGIEVSTAYISGTTPEQEESWSVVHLVPTIDDCVFYFSRLPVPCAFRDSPQRNVHVGLYAFTGGALKRFAERERGPIERSESIELMRFLEHGERIACIPIPAGSIGVDHPEDVAKVEARLAARG